MVTVCVVLEVACVPTIVEWVVVERKRKRPGMRALLYPNEGACNVVRLSDRTDNFAAYLQVVIVIIISRAGQIRFFFAYLMSQSLIRNREMFASEVHKTSRTTY